MSRNASPIATKITAPYGSWDSPINSQQLVAQAVRLGEPLLDGDRIYWIEGRPQEKGRAVLVSRPIDDTVAAKEVLPSHCNVRSRAHEYGGASYAVANGVIYFIEAADQRIYRFNTHDTIQPQPLTPAGEFRYADLCVDSKRQRIVCVREDHRLKGRRLKGQQIDGKSQEETNELVCLSSIEPSEPQVLVSGDDFYSNPQLSPNGLELSWICWNHPAMPWDASQCWLADLDAAGAITTSRCVAGADHNESLFQPQWSPAGELYLVSDRSDWWNLYRVNITRDAAGAYQASHLEPLLDMAAEFATPQWVFGMSCYGFVSAREILACYTQHGRWQLGLINTQSGQLTELNNDYSDISAIRCSHGQALMLAASNGEFSSLLHYAQQDNQLHIITRSAQSKLSAADISSAQPITFNSEGAEAGDDPQQAHGFYYAPINARYQAPSEALPPLIVLCHGGPTGATETGLNLKVQYWTSRGFAVMDVNYRGSTGYGRQYRQALHNSWGIKDVADVCAAAEHLVKAGLADADKLAIKGSSAGGYTVLAALTFRETFKAGASLYGIGDLEALASDTHKFEARYLDSLVGAYPEKKDTYIKRSPIHSAEHLSCPVIFFQGLDDKVVPPNQAEAMVAALDSKQVPVAYVPFPGEGHGFRQAHAITRAIDAELSFYAQVFNLPLSEQDEQIEPVDVRNLSGGRH